MINPIIQLGWRGAIDEGAQPLLNSFSLPVMEYARSSGLLSLMDDKIHLKMKTVKYSWQDKLKELICSIVTGCEHTVSINHRLVPDTTLARELIGKDRFADQSGINRLLHAFTEESIEELESVFEQDYNRNGIAWRLPKNKEMVWVDLDMTGFRADGATYEGATKGYVGKKGSRGYKASFAYVHGHREVLGCIFDNGRASISSHIDRLLDIVKERIGTPKVRDIVIRGDAALGNASIVDKCIERGYIFLFRGMHTVSARKYARKVKEWVRIKKEREEEIYAGELRTRIRGSKHRIRIIVFKRIKKDGTIEFWHLLTNLPEILYPMQMMFDLYHERQGIEAYLKTDKSGLHLKNLRTRNLVGIKAFVLISCITHNLIVHALSSFRSVIKKGFIGVKAFVEKLACARGWLARRRMGDDTIVLMFTEENPVIRQYMRCSEGPSLLDYT